MKVTLNIGVQSDTSVKPKFYFYMPVRFGELVCMQYPNIFLLLVVVFFCVLLLLCKAPA